MKIIIAGGSGQVGTILARHFHQNGYSVVVLSRSLQKTPWRVAHWDGSTLGPWLDELDCSDVLINLARQKRKLPLHPEESPGNSGLACAVYACPPSSDGRDQTPTCGLAQCQYCNHLPPRS